MITAEKSELKKEMLEACIRKQQALIDDFQRRIDSLFEDEGLGNEEENDASIQSSVSQSMNEVNMLNDALSFAKEEMNLLLHMRPAEDSIHEEAELGAVVVTDHNTFYISTSIEQFKVRGETYIGLSTQSPFFLAMQGKKKGEKFQYNEKTYHIKDIF